ncbi:serine hydrolase domain-containing protein [Rivularia sp. UHCC 0363]|uniref:serine hydrolase domain-containing protein n=1 Tax=Rivularia sp. UHCC 0363 TaxID=3110244 RepID=UPI002B1FA5CF|nr:serine hydrolase [Rivularia sp. UHCC 0363]MEA5596900.1 serine hydrolase [Rivularia sp. UHCC 0363]
MKPLCVGLIGFILFLSLSGLTSFSRDIPPQFPPPISQQQPTQPQPPITPSDSTPSLSNPQEFAAWVDKFMNDRMSKSHIPGTVISVVKDGKVFLTKGYGYANVEKKIPVDADKTLFRVASLSKLFTATAAMQLSEQGKLDINADANKYLKKFQIKNPFPEPVTAAQMMMHTDGTTKRRIGLAAPTPEKMLPLGDYLAKYMPAIEWQPGTLYSYSSHSTALLGYLVETISQTPFVEYIDKNILQPLSMRRTSFLQPPPQELADNLATGYQYNNGKYQAVPYLYLNIAPAAALSTTATDMTHFMNAYLLHGRYQDKRILKQATAREMLTRHFTHHPMLPGTGYSFRERWVNNIRTWGHLGSLRGYSASLTLLPERNIGIFIANNSFTGLSGTFLNQFFDRYFPLTKQPVYPNLSLTQEQLEKFTGNYRDVEYPRNTFAKITAPFKDINIKKADNGNLIIDTPKLFFVSKIPDKELVPISKLLFRRPSDNAFTAFGEDKNEQVEFAFNPLFPKIGAYEKIAWYESVWAQVGIAAFCTIMFFTAFIMYPIIPIIRCLRGKSGKFERQLNGAWVIASLVATLNLVFLIGFPLSLWLIGFWKLVYGVPTVVICLLILPLVSTFLTLALLIFSTVIWKYKFWSILGRFYYSLVTLAALIFVPFLAYWNLLGFQF